MPFSTLNRMLAALRRYTRTQEKDRAPEEMIEEFKAAAGDSAQHRPRPAADEEDRPTVH